MKRAPPPKAADDETDGGSVVSSLSCLLDLQQNLTSAIQSCAQGGTAALPQLTDAEFSERIEDAGSSHLYELGAVGIKVHYAWLTFRGFYPNEPTKPNQDTYKVVPDLGGQSDHLLLAVFDGHGQAGEKVAEFARDHIEETLVNLRRRQSSEPLQAYRTAFLQLNQRVRSDPTIDDKLSGTTAVSALFEGNQLHVANVGDSRAVMGERRDGRIVPTALSSDQTPYRPDERQRIRAAGGLVMSFTQLMGDAPLHDNWGVDLGQETDDSGDPPRIWQPDSQLPGCAFTRSIGDSIGEALGVTADPEIVSRTVSADDRILILASDGVWEFMTNQKAIDLVSGFDNPLDACRALLAEAYHLWMQYDTRTDDITAIVAFFEHPGEPPRASPSA